MSLGERTLEKRSGGEWCLVLDEQALGSLRTIYEDPPVVKVQHQPTWIVRLSCSSHHQTHLDPQRGEGGGGGGEGGGEGGDLRLETELSLNT